MKLHIISRFGNRIEHLSNALTDLGVDVVMNIYKDDFYKTKRLKLIKRHQIRNDLFRLAMANNPKKGDVFLISISPSLLAPLVQKFHNAGFKTILDVRNSWQEWDYHGFLKQRLERHEQLIGMKYADAITYVHPLLYSLLHTALPRSKIGKLFFVSNGANTEVFYPPKLSGSDPTHDFDSTINFVYAGRYYYPHGLYQWIEVLSHLKRDFHLTIVGYGDQAQRLRKLIYKYDFPDKVRMIQKKVSQNVLADYIRASDYALASINPDCKVLYDTTIETKTFEALCCGTPVLSIQGKAMDQFNQYDNFYLNKNFNRQPHGLIAFQLMNLEKPTNYHRRSISKLAHQRFSFKLIAKQMIGVMNYVREI